MFQILYGEFNNIDYKFITTQETIKTVLETLIPLTSRLVRKTLEMIMGFESILIFHTGQKYKIYIILYVPI